jgi:hypothetical protein
MMANYADLLADAGYKLIPVKGKIPTDEGWLTRRYSKADMRERMLAGGNIGLPLGCDAGDNMALVSIDVDIPFLAPAEAVRGVMPDGPACYGNQPKFKMLVRVPLAEAYSRDYPFVRYNGAGEEKIQVQVLGKGKQAVIFGVHPATGKLYFWDADTQGRRIFEMAPNDWPAVDNIETLIGSIARALEPFGWSRRASGVGGASPRAQAYPQGTEIPENILDAVEAYLTREIAVLAAMTPGTGRGTKAFEIGCWAGFALRDGGIDFDDVRAEVSSALGENQKDLRQFDNGVAKSDGQQFAQPAIDWNAEAAKMAGLGAGAGGGAAPNVTPIGHDGYRIALATLHRVIERRHVLEHGTYTSYAALIAEAATLSWRGSLYRNMAGDVVRVMPSAGAHGTAAPKGTLKDPTPPQVRVSVPTDDEVRLMIGDAVTCWGRVKIPDEGGPQHYVIFRDANGEDISWTSTAGKKFSGKTAAWARRAAHNHGRDAWLDDRDAWERIELPKGAAIKAVVTSFRTNAGTVGTPWLRSISTAPSFGRDGRLLMDDGPLETAAGEIVFTVQGAMRGHVKLMGYEEAKKVLMDFLALFPFADDVSESVGLALFFSLIARGAFGVGPAYVIDAPDYGAGKTFLAGKLGLFSGQPMNLIPCGVDKGEEELSKRFETALMTEASGMLLLDDVPHGKMPNFPTMRTYLSATTPELKIRRFGKNDDHKTVRTDATTLAVTGCAVEVSKDMVRRVLRTNLDPRKAADRVEWEAEACRLDLDAMYADPAAHGRVLGAALTILDHNWRMRPAPLDPSQNYEAWSRVVREAALAVTTFDPDASRAVLEAMDDDKAQWSDTLLAVRAAMDGGVAGFTVAELVAKVVASGSNFGSMGAPSPAQAALDHLIDEFELHRIKANRFSKRLGKFLAKHRDRPVHDAAQAGKEIFLRQGAKRTQFKGEKTVWRFE